MGLAASQCRLLLLTARKDDVEGQLMTFANQKLNLDRQAADISSAYSNALNAQKLVWKGDDGDDVDLSYGLLMKPNTTEETGQYLITNTANGKVMLDSDYINKTGLAASGSIGDIAKSMSQKEFIQKMTGITEPIAPAQPKPVVINKPDPDHAKFTTAYSDDSVFNRLTSSGRTFTDMWDIQDDNNRYQASKSYSSSSGSSPVCFYMGSNRGYAASSLSSMVSTVTSDTSSAVISVLQNKYSNSEFSVIESKLESAASAAAQKTQTFFSQQMSSNQAYTGNDGDNVVTISNTRGTNQIWDDTHGEEEFYVDVNQIAKTFLAYFDAACASINGDSSSDYTSQVGYRTTSRDSQGGTGDSCDVIIPTVPITVSGSGSSSSSTSDASADENHNDVSDSYEASYYANLYDAINYYGWQTNENVGTKKYIQNMVLNGGMTIKQLAHDGSWSAISSGDSDSPMSATTDTEGINKAEANYDAEKAKIDSKEQQIDLLMKNLDAERAAVDTEIDSVQKIIDKNIERSFKMFQQG